MHPVRSLVGLLPLAVFLVACGGGGSTDASFGTPCIVQASEPLVVIETVVDASSGAKIGEVTLSDITVNGRVVPLTARESVNAQVAGTVVQCKVACSFSEVAGDYVMTATAVGYSPAVIRFSAAYASMSGAGCTKTLSGSQRVSITLTPR